MLTASRQGGVIYLGGSVSLIARLERPTKPVTRVRVREDRAALEMRFPRLLG